MGKFAPRPIWRRNAGWENSPPIRSGVVVQCGDYSLPGRWCVVFPASPSVPLRFLRTHPYSPASAGNVRSVFLPVSPLLRLEACDLRLSSVFSLCVPLLMLETPEDKQGAVSCGKRRPAKHAKQNHAILMWSLRAASRGLKSSAQNPTGLCFTHASA